MPFKSSAQRGYMFANVPKAAKEFAAATPKGAKLPVHVKKQHQKKLAHTSFMKGLAKGGY